ncbi:hypothetical protein CN568_26465 [Bacillus pseudomycoides]|nr:hypothetical protein CON58_06785 [Bacillus pseudomycoides]PEK37239.1 hypothetical protein CN691_07795 [Bacillus pseudomycoides]PEK62662.1 hypothetical protein CN593_24975 [Bacillus pseudomycoides]PEO42422.1 hypothetical protein CN559_25195 [Bacillus pseudomycoides]PEP37917.1 hypothetical protein CN568_26465 [Bacillus pseudomycoides]
MVCSAWRKLKTSRISECNGEKLATYNDNYVNELSIWVAYFIFCLAWVFSKMLALPHRYQVKKLIMPQNEKISCFLSKIHVIFILRVL